MSRFDAERWAQIESILDRVFDAADGDRERLLDEACGDDRELRAEVEALLRAESRTSPLDAGLSSQATLIEQAVAEATDSTLEGKHLGPYRVGRSLGAGGMGVVYEGWDDRLQREVAIKVLPPGLGRGDAEARFLQEARTASGLDHPNICSIYDIGEDEGGRPYLVMARYRGETLKERLARGPLPIRDAVKIARQVAAGLERAHGAGVVHRDVKPANLFLTERDEVKILDFGLAKAADDAGLTLSGALIGTPAYMAPEQARGLDIGPFTDVWAFGVVLYEMVAGRRPFRSASGVGSLFAALEDDPVPLPESRPDAPPALVDLVQRCLAKAPSDRPRGMGEISAELDTLTDPSRGSSTSVGAGRRPGPWIWALPVVVLLSVGFKFLSPASAPKDSKVVDSVVRAERRGLVILPFQALQGSEADRELGRVIAEMLLTDLRGSPELDVLSSGSVRRAADRLDLDLARPPDGQQMVDLLEAVDKEIVLHGSFVQAGQRYRILASLERPASGDVLLSTQVESSTDGLFNAVDELTAAVRRELGAQAVGKVGVASLTTDSVSAMRAYTQALERFQDGDLGPARQFLERALELDPDFALAWRLLGLVHDREDRSDAFQEAMDRAFALADRLPPRYRFIVRGDHFASRWQTLEQGIEVYREAVAVYPDDHAFRNYLGFALAEAERYQEAAAQYERAHALRPTRGYAALNLSLIHTALGNEEEARDWVERWARRKPGDWERPLATAAHWIAWGEWQQAEMALNQAQALSATVQPELEDKRWGLEVLRGDWQGARATAEGLTTSPDERGRRLGWTALAKTRLFAGRGVEAMAALDRAYELLGWRAETDLLRAELWLELGRPAEALAAAERVASSVDGDWRARRAGFWAALAEQALGNGAAAEEHRRRLDEQARQIPGRRLARRLAGRLAWQAGDLKTARRELEAAAALLPARGIHFAAVEPSHVAIGSELGQVCRLLGDEPAARSALRRAAAAGTERLFQPVAWGRALHALGQLGDGQAAERFQALWVEADLAPALYSEASVSNP